MYSFIFPSNDYQKAAKLVADINNKFPEAEVEPVFNAESFFEAWKVGAAKTTGDTLILTHQDVNFLEIPNLDNYFENKTGLTGPAGGTEITLSEPWWFTKKRLAEGKLSGKIWHTTGENVYGPYREVKVLDGACLITKRNILEKVGVPKLEGVNWHFYDHVLSFEYAKKGYKLQTVPIKIRHDSLGGAGREFVYSRRIFVQKYL